jgi:hypothetical protein
MKNINFMPSYRIVARQRRRRMHAWVVVVIASLVLELGGIVAGYGIWSGGRLMLAGEQQKTATTIESAQRAIKMLQSELAAQEATLRASQTVQGQPDWSVLLALLAQNLGDGAALKRCELKPVYAAASAAPVVGGAPAHVFMPGEGVAISLKVSGYGQTVADILQFAQGLERAAIFDQIRLVRTDKEPLLSGTAIGFDMECLLGAKSENPQ